MVKLQQIFGKKGLEELIEEVGKETKSDFKRLKLERRKYSIVESGEIGSGGLATTMTQDIAISV